METEEILELSQRVLEVGEFRLYFTNIGPDQWITGRVCTALDRLIVVPLRTGQVSELLQDREKRRFIQDILPDTLPPVREMFLTGATPAEFDVRVTGEVGDLQTYEALGYVFGPTQYTPRDASAGTEDGWRFMYRGESIFMRTTPTVEGLLTELARALGMTTLITRFQPDQPGSSPDIQEEGKQDGSRHREGDLVQSSPEDSTQDQGEW